MPNWKRLCAVVLVTLVAGCASAPSDPKKPCPPLSEYTDEEQAAADAELGQVPDPCTLCRFMDDYSLMRDQCR